MGLIGLFGYRYLQEAKINAPPDDAPDPIHSPRPTTPPQTHGPLTPPPARSPSMQGHASSAANAPGMAKEEYGVEEQDVCDGNEDMSDNTEELSDSDDDDAASTVSLSYLQRPEYPADRVRALVRSRAQTDGSPTPHDHLSGPGSFKRRRRS